MIHTIRSLRVRMSEPFDLFCARFGLTAGTGSNEWYQDGKLFCSNNFKLTKTLRIYLHEGRIPYQERISSEGVKVHSVITFMGDLDRCITYVFPMMLDEDGVEVYGPQGSGIKDPEEWLKYRPELDCSDKNRLWSISLLFDPVPELGWLSLLFPAAT